MSRARGAPRRVRGGRQVGVSKRRDEVPPRPKRRARRGRRARRRGAFPTRLGGVRRALAPRRRARRFLLLAIRLARAKTSVGRWALGSVFSKKERLLQRRGGSVRVPVQKIGSRGRPHAPHRREHTRVVRHVSPRRCRAVPRAATELARGDGSPAQARGPIDARVRRARVPSLAPGSPLDSNERTLNARAFDGTRTMNSTHSGITDYRRTSGKTNEPHVSVRHARFDDALENDATFRYAYGGGGEMRARPMARQNAYGSAGERAFAEARTRALLQKKEARGDEDVDAVATHGPEWANGGYAGRGVSRRVLPYRRRRFDRDAPGAARGDEDEDGDSDGDAASSETLTGIACARCHCALPLTARFCSICGARVTSPASVVATAAGTRAVPPEPKRKQSSPRASAARRPAGHGVERGGGERGPPRTGN